MRVDRKTKTISFEGSKVRSFGTVQATNIYLKNKGAILCVTIYLAFHLFHILVFIQVFIQWMMRRLAAKAARMKAE